MPTDAGYNLPPGDQDANGGHVRPAAVPLPHIEDLLAVPKDIDANQSIKRLLELAETSLRQSEMSRDLGRPALALKEYIRASIIAVQTISKHKDYPALRNAQGDSGRVHNALLKRISQQSDIYEKVKRDIIEENKRTGVQPTVKRPAALSPPRAKGYGSSPTPVSSNGTASSSTTQTAVNGHTQPPTNGAPAKTKPAVQPKPPSLHGNAIQSGQGPAASAHNATLDLVSRFANLKGPQSSPGQDPRIKTYPIPDQRPSGPRDMPAIQNLSIDTGASALALPKVPAAIYSPARGSISGEAARLPTSSTPRGLFSRTASSASVPSTPSLSQGGEYFPLTPGPTAADENKITNLPEGDSVTANQLYEAMKAKGSILLIDVRSRQDFDEGHIMSTSIICIEPSILLRDNISSEEISESMVLSPNQEQPLFERRDIYDLVVFYDQSSRRITESPINSDQLVVLSVYRALVHLNYGRDLKRPPKILKGGLDAWLDLMGPGALQSTTSAAANSALARPKRNGLVQRKGSKYIVTSLQPADIEAWQSTLNNDTGQTATRPCFPRTGEEFLRFPPVLKEQQSLVSPGVVEERSKPGLVQKPGSPSDLPSPPARPRAAVQRLSHSGLNQGDDDGYYSESGAPPMRRAVGRSKKATEQYPGSVAKVHYTGLQNPRNWCYANSTLQSLLASPEFGRELADSEWVSKYRVPRKADEKIDPPQLMIQMISNLFQWMSTGTFESIRAQTLMEYSRQLCKSSDPLSQFGGPEQQDAQEFMSFIMEQLHDETNPRRDRTGMVRQPRTKGRPLVQAAAEYWDNHSEFNQSIIDHYWRGVELSTVRCMGCNTHTHTFSPFGWVPVTVNHGHDTTLSEVLSHYTAGNTLDDFACDHCKGKRSATQSMSFVRMPTLLCISFRRFHYDGRDFSKSNTTVTWDLNDFDFSPYFLNPSERDASTADKAFTGPFRYECYAVIAHTGRQLNTGHYVAFVRDSRSRDPYTWYCCNDGNVTKVRIGSGDGDDWQRRVFKSGTDRVPYLVFFRRR